MLHGERLVADAYGLCVRKYTTICPVIYIRGAQLTPQSIHVRLQRRRIGAWAGLHPGPAGSSPRGCKSTTASTKTAFSLPSLGQQDSECRVVVTVPRRPVFSKPRCGFQDAVEMVAIGFDELVGIHSLATVVDQ